MPAPETSRTYGHLCGIATALDVIGDRWAALVIRELMLGPLRFGELLQGLPGIGTNTLAARLHELEASLVVQRQLLPLPDRGTVYELTSYGRELQPILLAIGRWGTKSMGRLPKAVASRSRWLAAAMLAFHDADRTVARPTTWELCLNDGPFTVRAEGHDLWVSAGPAQDPDVVIATTDEMLHQVLTHRVAPADAIATGGATVEGDASGLARLLELFAFPALEPRPAS